MISFGSSAANRRLFKDISAIQRTGELPSVWAATSSQSLMSKSDLDEGRKQLIEKKRAEFEAAHRQPDALAKGEYPEGVELCAKYG